MGRVRGIGGVFFRSDNPETLRAWYAKHLGIVRDGESDAMFLWISRIAQPPKISEWVSLNFSES